MPPKLSYTISDNQTDTVRETNVRNELVKINSKLI